MFAAHQPLIARHARSCPEAFCDVLTFVQLTIQQSLHTVPQAFADVKATGEASRFLWGNKPEAYRFALANRSAIYSDAMELASLADPDRCEAELLSYFAAMPGLGLAKAGFVIQLCFGIGGCIDRHNVERFGIRGRPAFLRADKFKCNARARPRYVAEYREACHSMGGAELLWNEWCTYVYDRFPSTYGSAFNVSAMHASAIGLTVANDSAHLRTIAENYHNKGMKP